MIRLGPFDLGECVGSGAMGQVWSGVHGRSGTPVAAKLVVADSAQLDIAEASVRREARAIAGLQHPHVVYVYDQGVIDDETAAQLVGVPAGSPYIVMELLTGGTLADRHAEDGSWSALREDLERILEALAHCHARGILHRDLKPTNVLFGAARDARPGLKLVDFGIAWSSGQGSDIALGTPEYCAPEQLGNEVHAQGPWSDLYAVGAMAWCILTGSVPWAGLSGAPLFMAKASSAFRPFEPQIDVPDELEAWIKCCMAGPPGDRFQCAPDALHALAGLGSAIRAGRASVPAAHEAAVTRAMVGGTGLAARDRGAPPPAPIVRELIGVPVPPPALRDAGLGLWLHRPAQFTARMPQRVRLWQRLEHTVRDGVVTFVGLRGPTGSGRTRTARWLGEAAQVNGGVHSFVIRGAEERPLEGFVRQILRGVPQDPEGLDNARWMLEHRGITYRVLSDAVERWFEAPADDEALVKVARLLVQSLARTRPVVLILDDIDRCPVLHQLARDLRKAPAATLLVVATSTRELPEPFVEVPMLDPLRQREMSQLLASVLPLSIESTSQLVAASGGWPGRALDVARTAFESGRYSHDAGGLVMDLEPDPPASLPVLAAPLRRLLERAALLGVFPDRGTLTASFGNRKRADRALDHLAQRGLLTVEDSVIAFAPGVRKAVRDLPDAPWRAHHLALARTLPPESAEGAFHRIHGGEEDAGFEQLVQALVALDPGGELHRVLAICRRGLSTWETLDRPPAAGPWVVLVEKRVEALAGLRSERLDDRIEADLQRAWDHGVWEAVASLLLARAGRAGSGASRDLHFALEVAGTDAQRRRVLHGLARQAERQGDVPAVRYWLTHAAAAVGTADREALVEARIARCRLASLDGDFERAAAEVEGAIRGRPLPGELDLLAAGIQLGMGEIVAARSSLLRGVNWMTFRRDRRWLPTALVRLGLVELLEGNTDAAEARLAEADRIRAENRSLFGSDPALGAAVRLVLCLERGEWFRAMEALGHCPEVAWQRPTRVAVMARVSELMEVRRDVPPPVREAVERVLVGFAALKRTWFTR